MFVQKYRVSTDVSPVSVRVSYVRAGDYEVP